MLRGPWTRHARTTHTHLPPRCSPHRYNDSFGALGKSRRLVSSVKNALFNSEQLKAYPLVRRFLEVIIPCDELVPQRESFNLCCSVVDLVFEIKRSSGSPLFHRLLGQLQQRVTAYFEAHTAAYDDSYVIPKHHYMYHMDAA